MKPDDDQIDSGVGEPAGGDRPPQTRTRPDHEAPTIDAVSTPARQVPDSGVTPWDGAGPQTVLAAGTVQGRYKIRSVLGRGGMGIVYLAHDARLDRLVALKVPRLDPAVAEIAAKRFLREARAAANLSHPNICPVYDVSEDDGVPWIAMGYVQGRSLADYIASGKQQSERQVAKVVGRVALALQHAHEQGIVHRDLKPANIMIDQRGEPIVMDFGLAQRDDDMQSRLTREGSFVGTPMYMSPEQIDGAAEAGTASDIYSLGVVLYETLTGARPFEGNVVSVIGQVLHKQPPPPSTIRADLSPELEAICARAMAKDAGRRFDSMADMAAALFAFTKTAREAPTVVDVPSPSVAATAPTVPDKAAAPQPTTAGGAVAGRRKWMWLAASGGVLLLAAVALAMSFLPFGPPPRPSDDVRITPAQNDYDPSRGDETTTDGADSSSSDSEPDFDRPAGRLKRPVQAALERRFEHMDRNHNGIIEHDELPQPLLRLADEDQDGHITLDEFRAALRRDPRLFEDIRPGLEPLLPRPGPAPGQGPPGPRRDTFGDNDSPQPPSPAPPRD